MRGYYKQLSIRLYIYNTGGIWPNLPNQNGMLKNPIWSCFLIWHVKLFLKVEHFYHVELFLKFARFLKNPTCKISTYLKKQKQSYMLTSCPSRYLDLTANYKHWNVSEVKDQFAANIFNRQYRKHPSSFKRSYLLNICPFYHILNPSTINQTVF